MAIRSKKIYLNTFTYCKINILSENNETDIHSPNSHLNHTSKVSSRTTVVLQSVYFFFLFFKTSFSIFFSTLSVKEHQFQKSFIHNWSTVPNPILLQFIQNTLFENHQLQTNKQGLSRHRIKCCMNASNTRQYIIGYILLYLDGDTLLSATFKRF